MWSLAVPRTLAVIGIWLSISWFFFFVKNIFLKRQKLETKRTVTFCYSCVFELNKIIYMYIPGWIFQKVLAEIVQKGLILSQKALISNRRNFSLFALKSMRFPLKDRKSKDLPL